MPWAMNHRAFPPALLLALLVPATGHAETRSWAVGSFDRVRIEGPFDVKLDTGASPGARVDGERRTLDAIDISVEGTTLIVRRNISNWSDRPDGDAAPAPVVTLATPELHSANISAGARLAIGRMAGQQLDVSVNGTGALSIAAIQADQFNATLVGAGSMTFAGRAARAKLLTSGPGTIDATALAAGDLIVRLDGMGETKAAARFTASVIDTGLGAVSIAGNPACTVKALAGGPVRCGHAKAAE